MKIKRILTLLILISSYGIIKPSKAPSNIKESAWISFDGSTSHLKEADETAQEKAAREKFEQDFERALNLTSDHYYDTPPAPKRPLAATAAAPAPKPEAHVGTSMAHLNLAPLKTDKQEHEVNDFVDLFEQVPPKSVELTLLIAATKNHFQAFRTGLKKIQEVEFVTAMERRIAQANTKSIQKQLKDALSPITTFLKDTPTTLQAISNVEFHEQNSAATRHQSHEKSALPESPLSLIIIWDSVGQITQNDLKTPINMAELTTVLREPTSPAIASPQNAASPTSQNLEKTQKDFQQYNVLEFLNSLKVSYTHNLSDYIKKPKAATNLGAMAAAKK